MFLRLLKSSYLAGYLLFPVILAGTWINHLIHPYAFVYPQKIDSFVLFGLIHDLLPENLWIRTSVALFLLITNSYLLQRTYREFILPGQGSLLPAIIFILVSGGFPGFQALHPVWFALPLLLLGIYRLFASYDSRKPYARIFDTGILLSLGSLFYFNLIFLLPAFMVAARMLPRDARWREIVIMFLGALIPWIITFTVYFILDQLPALNQNIKSSVLSHDLSLTRDIPLLIFSGYLVLLTIISSNLIIRQFDIKKISFRKYFTIFFVLFVSCILIYFLIPAASVEIFIIALVPVSSLISNYFISSGNTLFNEGLFVLIIALVVYFQFL